MKFVLSLLMICFSVTVVNADPAASPSPLPSPSLTSAPAPVPSNAKLLPPITVSIFGGADFVSMSEVNQLVGTSLFKATAYYGLELRYPVSPEISILLRGERLSQGSGVGAANFSLSSLPVTAGVDFHSAHQRKLKVHFAALVGPGINTNLTETASTLPSPNVTEFSATAISAMARVSLEIPVSRKIGFFGEGGYRYLKTSSVMPSKIGSGSTIFQSNGQYQAVPINLSGPFIGGGLVFAL